MNQGAVPSFRSKYCPPRYPMPMATAISRPTAPVEAAMPHIFLDSRSILWLKATADGQKRHLVVGLAQAGRKRAHEAPQKVVGQISVHEEQVGDTFLGQHQ